MKQIVQLSMHNIAFGYKLLIFMVMPIFSSAQVKYFQDFENGFGDMIIIDQDMKVPALPVADFESSWEIRQEADGNRWAASNSYFENPGRASDWMITPLIAIDANTVLSWKAWSYNSLFPDQYEIRVSTNGGSSPSDFTKVIYAVDGENAVPTLRGLNLASYQGSNIRLAIRNISNDRYLLYIDDVKIENTFTIDGAITEMTVEKFPLVKTNERVSLVFFNQGTNPINTVVIEQKWLNQVVTDTFSNLQLNYLDSVVLLLKKDIISDEAVKTTLSVKLLKVNNTNDQNGTNNAREVDIHFVLNPWKRKYLVETLTSTVCGWCPKGIYYSNLAKITQLDDFIPINVHYNDVMVAPEYTNFISALYDFDNFPDMLINRNKVVDPFFLSSELAVVDKKYVPVAFHLNASLKDKKLNIEGILEMNTQLVSEGLKLGFAYVAKEVNGNSDAYNQANNYAGGLYGDLGGFEILPNPIPYSDLTYVDVALDFWQDALTLNGNYLANDKENISLTWDLDKSTSPENSSLIAFLSLPTGEIISTESVEVLPVQTIDFSPKVLGLHPNPATATIRFDGPKGNDVKLQIFTSMGTLVKQSANTSGMIDISEMETGWYFVTLTSPSKVWSGSFYKL